MKKSILLSAVALTGVLSSCSTQKAMKDTAQTETNIVISPILGTLKSRVFC